MDLLEFEVSHAKGPYQFYQIHRLGYQLEKIKPFKLIKKEIPARKIYFIHHTQC